MIREHIFQVLIKTASTDKAHQVTQNTVALGLQSAILHKVDNKLTNNKDTVHLRPVNQQVTVSTIIIMSSSQGKSHGQ